jgi:hypothetical protein
MFGDQRGGLPSRRLLGDLLALLLTVLVRWAGVAAGQYNRPLIPTTVRGSDATNPVAPGAESVFPRARDSRCPRDDPAFDG